jgi:hypothetical protein
VSNTWLVVFHVLMQHALRFVRAAQLPDDLEMLLDEQRLGVSVARAAASFAAVDASVASLKQLLLRVHQDIKEVMRAKLNHSTALENGVEKYSIRKMATGSLDDFHKGLSDRIGEQKRARWSRHFAVHVRCDVFILRGSF